MKPSLLVLLLILLSLSTAHARFSWQAISIPTRDGEQLAADLYTNNPGIAKPTVLIQTPYNKNVYRFSGQVPAGTERSIPLDTAAFNYLIVDWRGFYGSIGATKAGYDRGLDGYDVVEWIAAQPWSNGRIGTWGPSALGQIQFLTARQQPPHLVCAVPMVKDFKSKYEDYYFGGEFRRSHVETLQRLGFLTVDQVLQHPTNDIFWKTLERTTDYPGEIAVPMLLIGGWFDHFPDDVIRAFGDLQTRSAPAVRDRHRLIFGPWTHSGTSESRQGELEYPNAARTAVDESLRFLKHHLLDEVNGWSETPPVRYYQLGADEWRSADSWDDVVSRADTLSLYAQRGNLVWQHDSQPVFETRTLQYDPRDPSPTIGGSLFAPFTPGALVGPYNQYPGVEGRSDAILYTSHILDEDIEVNGPVSAVIYLSSDREDTDIAVRLTDVYPDGRSMLMAQGIRRLRFRNGYQPKDTSLGTPGTLYPVIVELQNLAITFRRGHSIRIIVTSSNYPHFDLNPNTPAPLYRSTDTLIATSTIFGQPGAPSSLRLPVRSASSSVAAPRVPSSSTILHARAGEPGTMLVDLSMPRREHVTLELFDLLGRRMGTIFDGMLDAGARTFAWQSSGAGRYFVRLRRSDGSVITAHGMAR